MATSRRPESAILLVAMLASDRDALALAADAVEELFGPAFMGMAAQPFTNTAYYRDELGPTPLRAFLAMPGLFPQDHLAQAKAATNLLEADLAARLGGQWPRPVNLDPGYLTLSKLVLASAKDFSHRIYLGNGIFAEITLQFKKGRIVTLPWTFPDYAAPAYHPFFWAVRGSIRGMEAMEKKP